MSQVKTIARGLPRPLPYAAQPGWSRRLPARRLIIAALLISVTVAIALWGRSLWNRIQLLYWQSRCLHYEAHAAQTSHVAAEWVRFYALYSPEGLPSNPTVYMHRRRSPCGNHRLIVVEVLTNHAGDDQFYARAIVPGGLLSRPKEIAGGGGGLILPGGGRILSGQSDASDLSHFTFCREIGSQKYVIDGWLADDDSVKLEPRDLVR